LYLQGAARKEQMHPGASHLSLTLKGLHPSENQAPQRDFLYFLGKPTSEMNWDMLHAEGCKLLSTFLIVSHFV
jgi:hypothetical protein